MTHKDCSGTTKATKTLVCLLLWMCVHHISGFYVSQEMKSSIQTIKQYYKLSDRDLYNNQPVIPRDALKTSSNERKMVYMLGVLETYEELIGRMLKQLPAPSIPIAGSRQNVSSEAALGTSSEAALGIRQKLKDILEKVQLLQRRHYQEQAKLLQRLQELKSIQMDNVTVQSKALVELLVLYEQASSLPNDMMRRRRRRRQTKAKTHLRG